MRRLAAISVIILSVGIGSAVAQPPPPPMPAAPPPPRVEVVPIAPSPRHVWEPGHWHWNGVQYVWIEGHYILRQPGWGHYVPGRWVWSLRFHRWDWIPAHWVR